MGNLASAIDELSVVDVRAMPDAVLVDEIVDLARQINRLHAAYLTRLEVVDRRGGMAAEHGSTAAWLRSELRLAPAAASRDVHLSRDLADVLPMVAAAMADGDVSVAHAQVLAGLRKDLADDVVRSADPHLADGARVRDPLELRGFVTSVRHSYAPARVVADEDEAFHQRRLHLSTTIFGTGVGNWICDPVSQETIMTAIHAASPPQPGDDRSPAQRRLDGLITVCEIALRSAELPDTGGVKPHVSVVIDYPTLLGLPGAAAARLGYGTTISGDAARQLACDADIARIITGPRGEILDSGRTTRTFTAAQRRAIISRDQHCRWPRCDRPPGWCDAHHRHEWSAGGATSVDNAVLICGRHHRQLHRQHLNVTIAHDGTRSIDTWPGSADRPSVRAREPERAASPP
jgi:Domain of unknown function (DUF222)